MASSSTLRLEKSELILPGLALPDAFRALDSRLDSTLQLCSLKGLGDGPLLGLVTVCQEMQTLLKLAFIENGLLASRMELLTRYQTEAVKSTDRKVSQVELSHKTTKKQVKRLGKKLSAYETVQRRKTEQWWDVKVNATDYDTFSYLSRGCGSPDLEFMLRINQILVDFVKDTDRQELILPPMGSEERAELSKLASTYKLRCRYGKSTQLTASTLIKARQTTIPNPGEVDAVLNTFARTHKRSEVGSEQETGTETQDSKESPSSQPAAPSKPKPPSPRITIPSSMLTPLSIVTSPTIDVGLSLGQSPPTSGKSTPTAEPAPPPPPPKTSAADTTKKSKEAPENPTPKNMEPSKPIVLRDPRLSGPTRNALHLQQYAQQLVAAGRQQLNMSASSSGVVKPLLASGGVKPLLSNLGGLLTPQISQSLPKPSTVVAAQIKMEGKKGEGEGSNKREKESVASPPKRPRLTRKSAGANSEQD